MKLLTPLIVLTTLFMLKSHVFAAPPPPPSDVDACKKHTSAEPARPCIHRPRDTHCIDCHSQSAQTHAHETQILPDRFPPPKTWPTLQKQVGCITCHDVLDAKNNNKLLPTPTHPAALRGGPYASFSDFCFNCHAPLKKELQKLNPHQAMVTDQGKIQLDTCSDCHSVQVTSLQTKVTAEHLKLPATLICLSCHKKTEHVGSLAHLDKKLTPAMLAHLKTFEKEHKKTIPLTDNTRVSCASCHQSHPQQVMNAFHIPTLSSEPKIPPTPSASLGQELLAFQKDLVDMRLTEGKFSRHKTSGKILSLQAQPPQLCLACHVW